MMATGHVQQVGTPAQIYSEPASPFVAEFVGTMNRLDCHVADGEAITLESGRRLVVGRHEFSRDEPLIALIRPEGISLTTQNGSGAGDETLVSAAVRRHTFLGATTRLELDSPYGVLMADVPSTFQNTLPLGTDVLLRLDPAAIRLLPRH